MKTPTKTDAKPTFRKAHVQPREITRLDEFCLRETGINKAHVRTLVQTLRNTGRLDLILLWKDNRDPSRPRLVLLDGAHRLAAYGSLHGLGGGQGKGVPAKIVECDPKTAHLMALAGNTRDCLPLTATERANAAWRLVMHPTISFSKAEIAQVAGVAPRTVANMRRRLKEMAEAGVEPSGVWWRDRQVNRGDDPYDLSDEDLDAKVKALVAALQGPLGGWKRERTEVLAKALEGVFGHDLRQIVEFIYGEDEFLCLPVSADTATVTEADF